MGDTDCSLTRWCNQGVCAADVCAAGSGSCEGAAVVACAANGSGHGAPVPCGAQATCVEASGSASCIPWVCTAGTTTCVGDTRVTCAADGLSIVSSVDCTATGERCIGGACTAQPCVPGTRFCQGGDVYQCNGTGTGTVLAQDCTALQYCDAATATCRAQICTPSQPACDGDVARVCNAGGSGYQPGGQPCTGGQICAAGACTSCDGTTSLRLVEVNTGNNDYVVVRNTSASCPAQLGGVNLEVRWTDGTTPGSLVTVLPTRALAPGAAVYVNEGQVQSTDIVFSSNVSWAGQPSSGGGSSGSVLLCSGACSSGSSANVLDAMRFSMGPTAPGFTAPVTFTVPLGAIGDAQQHTRSYLRTAFLGATPTFRNSDWTIGPSTPDSSCSGAPPSGLCLGAQTCVYATITCVCPGPFSSWDCR